MVGYKAGLQTVTSNMKWTHCCIHQEALFVNRLPDILHKTLNEIVQIINYVITQPLQSRLFSLLCTEMGSEHEQLLNHTEVHTLSCGKILIRFFEVKDDVRISLLGSKCENFLTEFSWFCLIAYLAGIFVQLNV